MNRVNRLTGRFVQTVTKPGLYCDGAGLSLNVVASTSGSGVTKSWIFRYGRNGRTHDMGLGPTHTVSLADARERALACRRQLLDGIDPLEARRAAQQRARLAIASTMTFKDCGAAYIAAHEAGWRNAKHRYQWRATLTSYVYPVLGALPVQAIDTALVIRVVEPIWLTKPETAGRVRGRIESILDWATVRGYRSGDNPARWRGHLDQLLPQKSKVATVRHQPAMPYADLPAFMAELRARDSISARALEFSILSCCRTMEAIGATWPEIDFQAALWTVPGARTKAARDHRVPLSGRAIEILNSLPREAGDPHMFIGPRKGRGLSDKAMLELLRGMAGNGYTVHGFRSAFRDWAAEQTNFPRELAEAALAHVLKDKTEAAYQRGDLLAKRRRLMDAWSRYCASSPRGAAQVVDLGARPA